MTQWKFRIHSTGGHIDELSRSSGSQQDFSVWKEEPEDGQISYWLSSPWVDGVADLQELANRLSALKCLVDGAMLLVGIPDRMLLGHAVNVETNTSVECPDPSLPDGLRAFESNVAPTKSRGLSVLAGNDVAALVFLARHDAAVRGCLLCLGYSGVSFVSLYQCRDFMNLYGACRNAALQACGVSLQELKRFDHSANNFEASGPANRHGAQGNKAPLRPMSEIEARQVLLPVVRAFARERGKVTDVEKLWSELPA